LHRNPFALYWKLNVPKITVQTKTEVKTSNHGPPGPNHDSANMGNGEGKRNPEKPGRESCIGTG
jgi:hypothetical protein